MEIENLGRAEREKVMSEEISKNEWTPKGDFKNSLAIKVFSH